MGAIISGIKKRRVVQVLSALFFNSSSVELRKICFPVLNCHSCPLAVSGCPLGVFANFAALRIFPFITVGILGLAGILTGRLACGWFCPFGWLQDMLYKLPGRKITKINRNWRYVKYVLLVGLVVAVPFMLPELLFSFCSVCPAGTLESSIPWRFIQPSIPFTFSFTLRLLILIGMLILTVIVSRGFCRIFCPLGALLGLFNRISFFRLRLTAPCTACGWCEKKCPMGLDPVRELQSAECIRCGECTGKGCLGLGVGEIDNLPPVPPVRTEKRGEVKHES